MSVLNENGVSFFSQEVEGAGKKGETIKRASSSPDEVLDFRCPQGLDAGERISIGVQGTAGKGLSQSNLMADSLRPP